MQGEERRRENTHQLQSPHNNVVEQTDLM